MMGIVINKNTFPTKKLTHAYMMGNVNKHKVNAFPKWLKDAYIKGIAIKHKRTSKQRLNDAYIIQMVINTNTFP